MAPSITDSPSAIGADWGGGAGVVVVSATVVVVSTGATGETVADGSATVVDVAGVESTGTVVAVGIVTSSGSGSDAARLHSTAPTHTFRATARLTPAKPSSVELSATPSAMRRRLRTPRPGRGAAGVRDHSRKCPARIGISTNR